MKRILITATGFLLMLALSFSLAACGNTVNAEGIWEDAIYLKDATVGEGDKEISVEISADDQSITLTVKTDAATLGEALYELELINDSSFFDTINGMKADWDADQVYWAFYVGEDYAMAGVSETAISGGESYRFVYTKG